MKYTFFLVAIPIIILSSCNVSPEAIHYNFDECAYCKMKISDIRFGAELVTTKGKIYKYDSAECLVRTYIEDEQKKYAYILVTNYGQTHNLMDASTSTYLISENQPSPMGGNLSAYEHKSQAEIILAEKGGKTLNFDDLIAAYKVKYK